MRFMNVKFAVAAVAALSFWPRFASAQTLPAQWFPAAGAPAAGTQAPFRTHSEPALERAQATPSIPGWVRAGLSVYYVAYSAFVEDGKYVDPIELDVTSHVTKASSATAAGTTRSQVVGDPLVSNYAWTCTASGTCRGGDWQFWVDPSDPTGSIRGPEGERFAIAGSGKYRDPWNRVWNATLLNYENPNNGVRFTVAYNTSTGLVLYNVESYPTEYIVEYYYS